MNRSSLIRKSHVKKCSQSRKIITLLLAFTYLLTAVAPVTAFASDEGATVTAYFIENDNHATNPVNVSIAVDGQMKEAQWYLDTPLEVAEGSPPSAATAAFLWDLNNLYVFVKASDATSIELTLNGYSVAYDILSNAFSSNEYNSEGKVDGSGVELRIPFDEFDITIDDLGLQLPFSLKAINGTGSRSLPADTQLLLSGIVSLFEDACNSRADRGIGTPVLTNASGFADVAHAGDYSDTSGKNPCAAGGTYRFYDGSGGADNAARRIYMGKQGAPGVPNLYTDREIVFEAELCVNSMPYFGNTVNYPLGFQIQIAGRNSGNNTLNMSIGKAAGTSTELVVYPQYANNTAAVPIGKSVGDTFTMTLHFDGDGGYTLLIDGVEKEHFPGALRSTGGDGTFLFNTYSSNAQGRQQSPEPIDVTIYEYRILSDHYNPEKLLKNALSAYSFDSIKGRNLSPDSVRYDLELPATFALPPFNKTVSITWTSSDESVISGSGAVTAGERDRAVTLTAAVVNGGATAQKTFALVVPAKAAAIADLTAYFVHEMSNFTYVPAEPSTETITPVIINVDGKPNEQPWLLKTNLPEVSGTGAPDGLIDLLWSTTHLYIGMRYGSDATTLDLAINNKTSSFDIGTNDFTTNGLNAIGNKSDGTLEIAVPLGELGFGFIPYDRTADFELRLNSTTGSAGTDGPVALTFSPLMSVKGDNAVSASAANCSNALNSTDTNYAGDSGTTSARPVKASPGEYILYDDGNAVLRRTYLMFTKQTGFSPYDGVLLEQDITILSMPTYDEPNQYGSHLWIWMVGPIINDAAEMISFRDRIQAVGDDGEIFYLFSDRTGYVKDSTPLGVYLGETFRLGVYWDADANYTTIYVNGEEIYTVRGAQEYSADSRNVGYGFNTTTGVVPGETPIDVRIDNVRVFSSKFGSDQLLDAALDTVTFNTIKGGNASENQVISDLSLPGAAVMSPDTESADLSWTSSDTSVIDNTGKVTRPAASGKVVMLTVTASFDGKTKSKVFMLFVPGDNAGNSVMFIETDMDPYTGQATAGSDRSVTFDGGYSSVVYDLGASREVNEVRITDSDSFSRITPSTLSLYISDDNVDYRMVNDWSFVKLGNSYYFYNFSATGRYVKVHSHLDNRDEQADFIASLQEVMLAYKNENLFGSSGAFTGITSVTASNDADRKVLNSARLYTISELGFAESALRSDKGDIRFVLNGRVLYHYLTGSAFAVRVPEIAAGGSVSIDVHYGSATATNISSGEAVYEVQYGTRTPQTLMVPGEFKNHLSVNLLPTGELLVVSGNSGADASEYTFSMRRSQDGGRTWSYPEPFYETIHDEYVWRMEPEGLFYDDVTGKLILFSHRGTGYVPEDLSISNMRIYYSYSEDLGETWSDPVPVGNPRNYFLSYTKPIKLSTYDGEGPGVDIVKPFASQYNDNGAFCTGLIYSVDGGNTFWASNDVIVYSETGVGKEGGTAAATLWEQSDGTLFMLARNQMPGGTRLAKAYSSDGGKTWPNLAVDSSVYAPNATPIIVENLNGLPVLFWGGNNVQGGTSYQRFPLNVAYSIDDCENFIGIQDLYLYTSLSALQMSANDFTNPHGEFFMYKGRDEAVFTWFNKQLEPMAIHITDFDDLLHKNKGAFDSFESGNMKYEGWLTTGSPLESSSLKSSEGSYSLLLPEKMIASRSIPYLVNGSVSMDVYFDSSAGGFDLELQSAYSGQLNKATPVSLHIDAGGRVLFYGADSGRDRLDSGLTLNQGWNRIQFEMDLAKPYCGLSLNGAAPVTMPVAANLGQYVCFVMLRTYSGTQAYIDRFIADCSPLDVGPQPGEPPLDMIFPLERLSLTGSSRIIGNVGTNTTANNSVDFAWSAGIEGSLLLGPGADWTQVIKSARPDAQANVMGIISNLDAPRAYPLPLFPAAPDLAYKGDLSAGTKPKDPSEITESGSYGNISVTKQLTVHVGNEDVHIAVNTLSVTGSGSLVINRTGTGRLILHVAEKFILSGSGRINHTGDPGSVILYYAGSDTVNIGGSTRFTGSLFARSADIALGGSGGLVGNIVTGGNEIAVSGSATADVRAVYAPGATLNVNGSAGVKGAVVARSIQLSGNSRIVYDDPTDGDFFAQLVWPKN